MGVYLVVGFGLMLALLYYADRWLARRKADQWQRVASELGLSYRSRDFDLPDTLPFSLFKMGSSKRADNILSGERDGRKLIIADYTYRVKYSEGGYGTHAVFPQTVCLLSQAGWSFPALAFFPNRFTDRMGYEDPLPAQALNGEDELATQYHVCAESAEALRAFLTPSVRAFLMQAAERKLHLELCGERMLAHTGKLREPSELSDLLSLALDAAGVAADRQASHSGAGGHAAPS